MSKNENEYFVEYIRNIIYKQKADSIDKSQLSSESHRLADALEYLAGCVEQTNEIAKALADGKIDEHFSAHANPLAAQLKSIQGNLKNLAWAAGQVAQGDYNQKILRMGRLTDAFDQMTEKLKNYSEEMEHLVNTDYLTGIGNRRHYNQVASELWEQNEKFTIAFVDMDGLKKCNDCYGHTEGDNYILEVCEVLLNMRRSENEAVFRLGGDEFLFLTRESSDQELEHRMQHARNEYCRKTAGKKNYYHDFSFGCVEMDPSSGKTQSEFLSIADQKMYNSKTIHYLLEKKNQQFHPSVKKEEFDKTGLDSRIFEVFASSAQNRYLYLCNMQTNVSRWSPQAVQDFDLPGEYMMDAGNIWINNVHPNDRDAYLEDIEAVFSGRKSYHKLEYRAKNKDGNYVICSCLGGVLKGSNGEPDLFAGTITNHGIVDNIDPVTNLYNVYEFLKQLNRIRMDRSGARFLCIAINQFSNINNAYGYEVGNMALQQMAKMLRKLMRGKGQVFRLDGVKFVMFLNEQYAEKVQDFYKSIVKLARNNVYVDQIHIPLAVSGAFLKYKRIDVDESTVYAQLMHVLSRSKKDRLGALLSYDPFKDEQIHKEMELLDAVKQSVLNNCQGFYLMYQPQVDKNGKIKGVEALLRYENAKFGLVPPASYIPFLENDACFYELGTWIMKTAMLQLKELLQAKPKLMLSINISYRQIEHFGFRDDVLKILRQTGFPPENLVLELTEHCQTLNPQILEQDIRFFKSKGIKIAADDFGTGYSSFSLMRQLSFDCIKIDKSFISHILEDRADQIMVESIISGARKMGFSVCVEGVETEEVLDFLKEYGAELYQGYYFSKPLKIHLLEQYIQKN